MFWCFCERRWARWGPSTPASRLKGNQTSSYLKLWLKGVGGARGTALLLKDSEACLDTLTASTLRTGLDPNEQAIGYPEKRVLQAALDHGPFLRRGHAQF